MKAVEGGPTPGLRLFSDRLPTGCVVSPMAIRLDEPEFGGLQGQQGLFAGAGEVVNGVIFDRGDGERCGIPRAHQPRQLRRLTPAECDAVGRLHTGVVSFVRHMTQRLRSAPQPLQGWESGGAALETELALDFVYAKLSVMSFPLQYTKSYQATGDMM
jgi:hypothetical protein